MLAFEFATAARIIFGAGTLPQVVPAAKAFGKRVLVVTGKSPERARPLLALLQDAELECTTFSIPEEPTIDLTTSGAEKARAQQCELVLAFGGGSVIDSGKAIAAMLTNRGDLLDYLEVIGKGKALEKTAAPVIAIPTTAGTGSEVTPNAVISSPEHKLKVSLRSPSMLPRLALVDPELTYDLPPELTASTGLDALTQLLEAYVSIRANSITDALCLEGLGRASRSLRKACAGHDPEARSNMALASLFSGLALANAGLGAVHGFAAAIGGMFRAPHGAACAGLLPEVMLANLNALSERMPNSPALSRFTIIARLLSGNETASAEQGIQWLLDIRRHLRIPGLRAWGIQSADIPELVRKAAASSSMKGNPVPLHQRELERILHDALARP